MRDWPISEHDPWAVLARYNAEVSRGLMHTDEWRAEMDYRQQRFDEEQHAKLIDRGFTDVGGGVMCRPATPRPWWRFW